MTKEGRLLCAREGSPGRSIPQHKQIGEQCLAAGNLYFAADFSSITNITHRSGDFHPTVASLVWPIAIIYLMGAKVADPFIIEESSVSADGRFETIASHSFSIAQIAALLPEELRAQLMAANNSAAIEVRQSNSRARGHFFNTGEYDARANLMTQFDEAEAGLLLQNWVKLQKRGKCELRLSLVF